MIEGYVISNAERPRHIFKQGVLPGMKISLGDMYAKYKNKYQGGFDVGFLEWLEKNKLPEDFDIVINSIDSEEVTKPQVENVEEAVVEMTTGLELDALPDRQFNPEKMTPKELSELKIKDNPKNVIGGVMSVHKLRRTLTLCKDRPGKGTLTKLIRTRISELK